ncbi:hypothetical protein HZA38_00760 [Candidatus Peregrinibacteria bacterium]|nr:hypothetical protein [Candidatus Peregrinibacteria bacterium]
MKQFLKKLRGKNGAILIEVLISLIVFTIGAVASLSLLMASSRANVISKNRIIAINLAEEALEVVRNIRDTNWMVYSSNLRECWNFSPDVNEDGIVGANENCVIANGQNNHPLGVGLNAPGGGSFRMRSFIVDFDSTTSRWIILPASDYLNANTTFIPYGGVGYQNGEYPEADPIDTAGSRTSRLYINGDGRYTHLPAANPSLFYRTLDICYIDNITAPTDNGDDTFTNHDCNDSGFFPTDDTGKDNRILVTAKVFWKDGAADAEYKTLTLETLLTDYFERESWND